MTTQTAPTDLYQIDRSPHGIHMTIYPNAWILLASLLGLTQVTPATLRCVCDESTDEHDDTSDSKHDGGFASGPQSGFEGLSLFFDSRQNWIDAYGHLNALVATKEGGEISIEPYDLPQERVTAYDERIPPGDLVERYPVLGNRAVETRRRRAILITSSPDFNDPEPLEELLGKLKDCNDIVEIRLEDDGLEEEIYVH